MRALSTLCFMSLAAGCTSDPTPAATLGYAQIVSASYEDAVTGATNLKTAVDAFLAAPSQATLEAARKAWKDSREPYLQTEVFRFYDGPIDKPDTGPEGLINAWPMDENYVDYVEGDANAGIINDTTKMITADELAGLNEGGGEKNISTGFHPIEFLLWGQDKSDTGPGNRPFADYLTAGGTANADRRRTYLTTATTLLIDDLKTVRDAWLPGAANYRASFEAAEPSERLRRILTGMIVLSGFETGGERLQAALDSGDQEDEHSCFSDNTHRDMIQDVRGVQNVFLGRYTRVNGTTVSGEKSIYDVVAFKDQALADQLKDQIAKSLMLAEALQPPFDNEIAVTNTAGRARVTALIQSLRAQEMQLQRVFQAFGLTIPMPE
jgi:putative iron-regulated protein